MEEKNKNIQAQEQEDENISSSSTTGGNATGKYVIGIILLILGFAAVIKYAGELWTVIAGCMGIILIIAGAITIAIAKE